MAQEFLPLSTTDQQQLLDLVRHLRPTQQHALVALIHQHLRGRPWPTVPLTTQRKALRKSRLADRFAFARDCIESRTRIAALEAKKAKEAKKEKPGRERLYAWRDALDYAKYSKHAKTRATWARIAQQRRRDVPRRLLQQHAELQAWAASIP